jgi:hypothetical protein
MSLKPTLDPGKKKTTQRRQEKPIKLAIFQKQ